MKKIIFFFLVTSLASCKGNSSTEIPNSDTVIADWKETQKVLIDQLFYGNWEAHIEHNPSKSNDSLKLVVTGSVELERPGAKVILIKSDQQQENASGELILNLSKRPRKTMNNPATIMYTETLQKIGQYKRIHIIYRKDKVAIINHIANNNNK